MKFAESVSANFRGENQLEEPCWSREGLIGTAV
jgi:hypothetical protein